MATGLQPRSARQGSHGEEALTAPSLFTLDYIATPAALTPEVTTFYHFRCDELLVRDIQPAAVGHLALFPYGRGHMRFPDGSTDRSHETNLMTPFSQAVPFEVDGPFHAIGAAMTPLGWAALTGMGAAEHGNRLFAAADWLGEEVGELGAELCAAYRAGELNGVACAMCLGDYIGAHLKPVKPRHKALIKTTSAWLASALDPSVGTLYETSNYSDRQVQRLVERYFGLCPRELARKYRALRTAALLSLPMLSDEAEAEIAEAFYDESHRIREIRHFAGRTPRRLHDPDNPLLGELISVSNLRELEN